MSASNIVSGGCVQTSAPSDGGQVAGVLGAIGGLAQAAISGNLTAMLKNMAIEKGKQLVTALLTKLFTLPVAPKPPKPPWTAMGKVAPPGSAFAAAAMAAYNSVHAAPSVPGAGSAGAGSAGGTAGGSGAGNSPAPATQQANLDEGQWVDIDFNDVVHTAVAALMMPAAFLLRGLAAVFPSIGEWLKSLEPSWAGTGDKCGLGILVGNNDGNGIPGVVGIAFSLAHELLSALGLDSKGGLIDGEEFERGQRAHDDKTGRGHSSDAGSSAGDTVGQLLGILARKVGLGNAFYSLVASLLGPPTDYGFVAGVWKGSHQEKI